MNPDDPATPVEDGPGPVDYVFGRFRISPQTRQLLHDGQPIGLSAKTFDVLLALVRHHERILSKDELIKLVWRDAFVSDDSLSQSISALRRTLGDDPYKPSFILTVPKQGYRFVASVVLDEPMPYAIPQVDVLPSPTLLEGRRTEHSAVSKRTLVTAAAVLLGVGFASGVLFYAGRVSTAVPLSVRLSIEPLSNSSLVAGGALSPDGSAVAFAAENEAGQSQIWIRRLNEAVPRPITGTEGGTQPFWAPSGERLAFFGDELLKSISPSGGAAITLANVGLNPSGGSWGREGSILVGTWRNGIVAVPEQGGNPRQVTKPDPGRQERAHWWPQFLPDGRRFLYYVNSVHAQQAGTFAGTLDSIDERQSVLPEARATYAPEGALLYVRDRVLFARRIDPTSLEVDAEQTTIAEDVSTSPLSGTISTAPNVIALSGDTVSSLRWFARSGQPQEVVASASNLRYPEFFADRKRVVVSGGGIVLVEPERGAVTRIATNGLAASPAPDGSAIAFASARMRGVGDVVLRRLDSSEEQMLVSDQREKTVTGWSPDGRHLVFVAAESTTNRDVWLLEMSGHRPGKSKRFTSLPGNEIQAVVSPRGRWMAYSSNESGNWEVYVQSFPVPGLKMAASNHGGSEPSWSPDGSELYYVAPDRTLMAVNVRDLESGAIGKPTALFRLPVAGTLVGYRSHYAPTPDGQRFLVDSIEVPTQRNSIAILLGWHTALAER